MFEILADLKIEQPIIAMIKSNSLNPWSNIKHNIVNYHLNYLIITNFT